MIKNVSFPMLPPKVATLYSKGYPLHKAMNLALIGKTKTPKKIGRKK